MRSIDYQGRILECSKQAENAPNEEARRIWKRMEEFWRQKALQPKIKRRTFDELRSLGPPPTSPN